jgi:hypothetical protein
MDGTLSVRRVIAVFLLMGAILLGGCSSVIYVPVTITPEPMPTTAPVPTTIAFPAEYTEIQISLKPGEIYRVNVFAEIHDVIEYSWKAEELIQFWYTTSMGTPMKPRNDWPMSFVPSDNPYYEPSFGVPGGPQLAYGDEYSIKIEGNYYGTGYYTFKFMPFGTAIKPVPLFFRYRVGKWTTIPESTSAPPPTQQPRPTSTTTPATLTGISPSDITGTAAAYDGKKIELSGQTFLTGSSPKLLVDGKSGINLGGNTAGLQKGFYRIKGLYHSGTNTLDVTEAVKEDVEYTTVEAGKQLGINLVPVSVQGLIATPPKEIANMLSNYLSIPNFPKDVPVYPYVAYSQSGFYVVICDALIHLPVEFTFFYQGKDYSFTFSAGEVKGTLVKTSLEQIDFGPAWGAGEFGGVILANSIAPLDPVSATVKNINANPADYSFKRVTVPGSYIVTTATIDYSDVKAPMGQGILADDFSDFFKEDSRVRLETIDPNRRVWQLRESSVTGTVIYPTEEVLKYLDYSAPLTKAQIVGMLKPALIVDTLADDVVSVANISELNPVVGNLSKYWGKVVEFEAYALGINYPLKEIAKAMSNTDVPVNVNLLAVGIADKPAIGSQLAIIGLNNDLTGKQGEVINGRYKFRVAVTHVPEQLVSGVPYADTAFFLLSKEELPAETPKVEYYSLNISIDPAGAGSVAVTPPGSSYLSGTAVTLTALPAAGYVFDHWSGDASGASASITILMDKSRNITAYFRRIL